MRYLGGKVKIAKAIAETIRQLEPDAWLVYEPFMGGANVTVELAERFSVVLASDAHVDLILMWQAAKGGWVGPGKFTKAEYDAIRHATPSALRGLVGFGLSFGGKWFGGFVGEDTKRDRQREPARAIAKQIKRLHNVDIIQAQYQELSPPSGAVVYLDPPYASTTGYATGNFNNAEFWETAARWRAAGAKVYVSEYAAPAGWASVWSRTFVRNMKSYFTSGATVTEHLFA